MAIPKIIHQVWEGRTEPCMPTRLQILARTWREQNPDWEYHLWNGEEMDELVEKHFPEYLSMYSKRLSKYIFYSSFSLLTFATKK